MDKQRKGQFLYNTLAKEIIDNEGLQKDWLFPNEESLIDEYIVRRFFAMGDTEFDEIITQWKSQNNGDVKIQ